jgi:hypothetical protein
MVASSTFHLRIQVNVTLAIQSVEKMKLRIWIIGIGHDVYTNFHEFTPILSLDIKYETIDIASKSYSWFGLG